MQIYEVILIGLALSIDACAITIVNCTACNGKLSKLKEWSMPIVFAIFQGLMPLIGYFIGSLFSSLIASITKFITATIFLLLAIKIIIDIINENKEQVVTKQTLAEKSCQIKSTLSFKIILLQGLATSIDALAVGVTLIDLSFSIYIAIALICAVTFVLVGLSLLFGKTLGKLFGKYAQWLGAGILFALAIKSLIEGLI